ncbi:hypothetical protein IC607_08670 [Cellulomonas sp. JH27-2]|uniref:hypothetical protein n=1 Tax=Cellulomonas sp. JH27-2 TaxID=2774139 RepID=UPI0017815517|nr:hypothetical protein [Cellulomonas sp. JH27-2]MBD8059040.1 hypothetical protein [Cellulomonas sp. JH27-2]
MAERPESEVPYPGDVDLEDEARLQRLVLATFPIVDQWQKVSTFVPGSGSQLKGDDTDWPPFAASQVAWFSIASAVEHLYAVRVHLEPLGEVQGTLLALAHQTLVRTALVSGSIAVWMLAPPERALRVKRAREYTAFSYDQHRLFLAGLLEHAPEHTGTQKVLERVEQRRRELAVVRLGSGEKSTFNTTRTIEVAASIAFPPDAAREVVLGWRVGSGAAHALPHSLLGRPGVVPASAPDGDGTRLFTAQGSFAIIANQYMAAYYMTNQAWHLLRERGL